MEFIEFKPGDLVRRYHVGDYKDMFQPPPVLGMVTKTGGEPPEVSVCWLSDLSVSNYTTYAAVEKLVLVSSIDNVEK